MGDKQGVSFRRPVGLSLGAAAMGVVTATVGMVTHPEAAHAIDYPTWNDVQNAKANVAQQQAMVDRINQVVAELEDAATDAGIKSEMAVEAYNQAQGDLQTATDKANKLQSQSEEAEKTAKTSAVRAGLLASHLMRTAGTNGQINLLLQGDDSSAADRLLYQLGTMSQLTEQSKKIYDQAISDRNTAKSVAEQAQAAQQERKKAADAAKQAYQAAQVAAAAAQAAVTTQQQKQSELTAQLASLQNISVETAKQYVEGQQVIAAQKAAAAAAAKQKAQQEAAAAAAAAAEKQRQQQAAAQQQSSSGSSGGGSSSSGSSSGGSAAAPVTTTRPPASAIVAQVIAYARAQLGKPYVIAGAGPNGFDCSGLTMMAYASAGLSIGGHGVIYQYKQAAAQGKLVPRSQAQPGDLLFWGTAPNGLYHVGIYIGGGQMIAAPKVGDVVKIQAVWGTPIDVVARPSIGY